MDAMIEKYIQLRDAKDKLAAKYKTDAAKITEVMTRIEGFILESFTAQGVESARCNAGTAYKSVRTSATVADWDATLNFIRENEAWNLLDHRVGKKAVEEYKEANGDIPPGLNWREEIIINVRRS